MKTGDNSYEVDISAPTAVKSGQILKIYPMPNNPISQKDNFNTQVSTQSYPSPHRHLMPVTPNSTVYVLVVADVRDKTQMHYAFSTQAKADAFVTLLQVGAGLLPASTRGNITYIDLTLVVDSNQGA